MSTFVIGLARGVTRGVVAVAALAGATGCSAVCLLDTRPLGASSMRSQGLGDDADVRPTPPAAPVPAQQPNTVLTSTDAEWADESEAPAQQHVNIFGELDGVERRPGRAVGESGFQQHTSVDEGEDSDVAIDPTGRWLVFASTRHNESGDIYLQRVDGTSVTQLTNDAARDAYPAFSPDGKWVAFSSTRTGTWQVYRMDLDGRNVVQVTSGPMQAIHPSFSPDGSRLVYSALGARSRQWELWTVDLVTGERRQIGYGLFPSWSPDKATDRIAYQRARQRGSRWFSLWTLDLVNGEGRRMTEVAVSSNAAIVAPCWSPDGKRLAFTTVVQGPKGGGQQDVWTVDADGANRHRLTDGNGSNLSPAWAADHRVYFVSDRGGNESIWSVRSEPVDAFTADARRRNQPAPVDPDPHARAAPNDDGLEPVGVELVPLESADTKEVGH